VIPGPGRGPAGYATRLGPGRSRLGDEPQAQRLPRAPAPAGAVAPVRCRRPQV